MNTVHTRKTPEQIRRSLAAAVKAFKHRPDVFTVFEGFAMRLGFGVLSCFYQAYLTKAKGGTDEMGIKWEPLKRKTIAYNRPHPGLAGKRQQAKAEGRPGRPLLSKDLDALWRRIYARKFYEFSGGASAEAHDASGHAAAYAWAVVKSMGGQTIIDTYGDTPVEIGRSSGRALNAMAMAVKTTSSNTDCQVRQEEGAILVAIRVGYMVHFHNRRPLWNSQFPQPYRDVLDDISKSFFSQAIPRLTS